MRNVATAWKKKRGLKGNIGKWEGGGGRLPASSCVMTHTKQRRPPSHSVKSAHAGNSSIYHSQAALRRCHALEGGSYFRPARYSCANACGGTALPIRFGRVKSNARDSQPERRPNPELVVNRYLPLADERLDDPTRQLQGSKRRLRRAKGSEKFLSIVPESHVNPSSPEWETRFRSIMHHGQWCPILLLLAVCYHGVSHEVKKIYPRQVMMIQDPGPPK